MTIIDVLWTVNGPHPRRRLSLAVPAAASYPRYRTLNLLAERALDHFRKPEDRIVQPGQQTAQLSTWELRHQIPHALLLLRLPFLFAGCVLGGALWWVTRRLYGNFGGYTALALYCFSPSILKASIGPNPEILAAAALYGGVYTCIGVAHAMQGPGRRWRPRRSEERRV